LFIILFFNLKLYYAFAGRPLRLPARFLETALTDGFIAVAFAFAGRPLRFAGAVTGADAVAFAFAGRPLRFAGAVTGADAVAFAFAGRPLRFAVAVTGADAVTFFLRPLRFAVATSSVADAPIGFLRLTNLYPPFNRFSLRIVPHPLTNFLRLSLFVAIIIVFFLFLLICCF
jgi:hypothetical protein